MILGMIVLSGCGIRNDSPLVPPVGKQYVSEDPKECMVIKFMCVEGKQPFFDDKGCGCEPIAGGKLKAYDCTDPRPEACTKEYIPVCGQVQVQCIKAPCPPIMQTFGNKCEACANPLTISYTEGACASDAAGGTVLAGTPEEQCTGIGGQWTGYDCVGLSQEQCTELGGEFNECASACRNDPDAEICTLQCVQVCNL